MESDANEADADGFVPVVDAAALESEGRKLVTPEGTAIALFHHEGAVRAVDNRCPHMGFPLSDGTVEEGILTCHWHHARFELSCGDTFDPWADDVQTYPVEIRDGTVHVDPNPPLDRPPAEHWADRLESGLQENLRLVVAKSTIGLLDADVDPQDPLTTALEFGTQYREDGWSSGLTIQGCMANLLDSLDEDDRKRALYTGIRHVAADCAGQPAKFDQPSFSTGEVSLDRLRSWFRDCIEVRDQDGAERCLRTAVAAGYDDAALADLVFTAATDHPYLSTGHTLDFANKAFESLDAVGWPDGGRVGTGTTDASATGTGAGSSATGSGDGLVADTLASLVEPLATATRSDETSSWRQPVDLVALLADVYGDDVTETSGIESLVEAGRGESWDRPADVRETLLGDDPAAIVETLTDAIRNGATAADLAAEVTRAATTRVAQFGTANEFGDWNTVHHTFTYANAVHQATRRTDAVALYRGVFDAALSVYLDRFLNTPPAPIPEPGDNETGRDPGDVRDDLLATFDEKGQVNEAGRLVAEYFDCGGEPADLQRTLGHGLLREDAGFHTLQNVEAAFRQHSLAETDADRRLPLVATARYMAAHFPTNREAEQTFAIAARLNRGERVHEG
ncbi:ferredoxin subunit of nitrite reductase and ring-hydroxylating dioxygenase [Halovivax ruber XH-70]|uniref:Ferredoxin subunit of nitrite reductase and ring-hydroxylating dioxygenase n=1 Tax=Halovivax ruber (strain DSM 18193 / JCM 13892 / XH-70) TaxID=797302 RepID=L0IGM1_HALRX|nr:Rieske (2Fe-2S) protein [Halovivax ruber]AGB17137.1 ferredoxin subunit of nitrite reductase and ring-hydroxylating dioxygenase [Halovivax ruber XH-70]